METVTLLAAALLGAPVAGAASRAGRSHRSKDRGDSRRRSRESGSAVLGAAAVRAQKTVRPAGQAEEVARASLPCLHPARVRREL